MGAVRYNIGGCFVREIDRFVYPGRVVDEFEKRIDDLDSWSGEHQLIEFSQQGLMFEARVIKTGSEVCVVYVYANTPQLDVLADLEEELMYRLEQRLAWEEGMKKAVLIQAYNIRSDESFVQNPIG